MAFFRLLLAAFVALSLTSINAGTVTYNFTTDPTTGANPIKIFQSGFANAAGESVYWKADGGNTGGFLGVTWPLGSSTTIAVFPDIDDGKLVTAFKFETDIRVGNPQQADRAADGFSINFARSNDPVFQSDTPTANDFATAGAVETGTTTGISISFDTWSGNTLPDGADIEGIIVRVDNKTVLRHAMPTRNGACADATSLQTGPRDLPYWEAARAAGTMPDAAFEPGSWAGLCWQKLVVEVDSNAQLTVIFKGQTILDHFQTTYFPSAGGLVLAGRTGGADQHSHFDNLVLTTTAVAADTINPTVPANLRLVQAGALRAVIATDPATDNSGRVGYEIEQNGVVLAGTSVLTTNDMRGLSPTTAYTFRVRATDVSGNKSDWSAPLTVNTVALVEDQVFAAAKIYGSTAEPISGTAVDTLTGDARYPATPTRIVPVAGLTFGEPNFGDTFGDNFGIRIAGTVTPPETGQYHFFVRSDDASQLFVNAAGPAIPVAGVDTPVAEETGCCEGFKEPNPDTFETTTTPIQLTAGQRYGVLFLVKEGGGGDWGQVAWRKVGDTTAAASLAPIAYPAFVPETKPMVDPVGAVANITQQPASVTTVANERVTFSVKADTASPYGSRVIYQWFKNGVAISGATTPTFTIPVVAQADSGAKYSVLVAVQGKSVTSSEASLTVNADNKAPTIQSITWLSPYSVSVGFSEPVKAPTAANFALSGGVNVTGVQQVNPTTVVLATAAQAADTTYTLTVTGVQDNANNAVGANTTAVFKTPPFVPGKVKFEEWAGIGGVTVAALRADPTFPVSPDRVEFRNAYEAQVDIMDNFGGKLSGWITPATTGNYVFFLSADDNAELYLSTDANPANAKLIAAESAWSGARDWVASGGSSDLPSKRSDQFPTTAWPSGNTITLQAGQKYYTEVLYKEGGGGDNAAVLMQLASAAEPVAGAPALTGNVIGTYVPSLGTDVTSPTDTITGFGGTSPANEAVVRAIDNTTQKYLNFGTDGNNTAPFVGPVGLVVTPAAGASVVTGLRIYNANDAPDRDPADYILEGSTDGTTFTTISSGPLALTAARNVGGQPLAATNVNQVVTFANHKAYTTYRFTVTNVKNNTAANSMQFAELELLGFISGPGQPAGPKISIARNAQGVIAITYEGTLEASDTVNGTYAPVAGATSPHTVNTTGRMRFYRARQ